MAENFEWMNEHIDRVPKKNGLYKFACFFLGRRKTKLTYKEMYLILANINRKAGEKGSKEFAFKKIIEIYKFLNNNEYPKM